MRAAEAVPFACCSVCSCLTDPPLCLVAYFWVGPHGVCAAPWFDPSWAPPLLTAGLWQLAAAVDVIDFEELSFGKLLGAGAISIIISSLAAVGVLEFINARCISWSCCLDGACRGVEIDGREGGGDGDSQAWGVHLPRCSPWPCGPSNCNSLRMFGASSPLTSFPSLLGPRGPCLQAQRVRYMLPGSWSRRWRSRSSTG